MPPLLFLELLNIAARRWGWTMAALTELAANLSALGFEVQQPSLSGVARWCGRGLTAYDACYVALAEERSTVVITADERMLSLGGQFVRSLTTEASER